MKMLRNLPPHVIGLFQKMGIALLLLTLTRLIFFFSNSGSFSQWQFSDFLAGMLFDCFTIGIYFIPIYALTLLPIPWRGYKIYKFIDTLLFFTVIAVLTFLNLMDVEYFNFTSKRSTADLFSMLGAGNDLNQLLTSFIRDFWLLILLFISLLIFSIYLFKKVTQDTVTFKEKYSKFYLKNTVYFLILTPIFLVIGRGGFSVRPAGMLTATQYTRIENTALVLNTPFTMIKSLGKNVLEEKKYFKSEAEIAQVFSTKKQLKHTTKLPEKTNVMVIILESFGNEWLGTATGDPYTPFLDSLITQSRYYKNAFANGKKSIEAVPSIFGGIPSWMDNPYITSLYGNNKIETMITKLKRKGYSSAFYHGATNGSMKFDEFSELAGFDNYVGRKEYNNEQHADATWGILDEYFEPWTAKQLSKLKAPFVSGMFTLSSHHPYYVPEKWRNVLPKGKEPMTQSIAYGDMSLKLFFEEAKKQDWYKNTLFVILADHTPAGTSVFYQHRIGMYRIPILFFDPSGTIQPEVKTELFDQIDIYPTVMDLITKDKDIYSFGQSAEDAQENTALYYLEGTYLYLKGDYLLTFAQEKAQNLYNYHVDSLMFYDSITHYPKLVEEMETDLKARIQTYNHDLITNQMNIK